jgi:segregation and condensation protein B
MTAEDDAEVFQVLAAQLESEGSLSTPSPPDSELHELDPNVVPADVRAALEAILLVASDPVAPTVLAQLLEVSVETVNALCEYLTDSYAQEERGFTINRVAGGYRYQTSDAQAPYVERFVLEGQATRLSAAALETLAIVAYKQPVSRAQISLIRGVNVDSVARTLQQRGYIEEVGRDPGPGNAAMYGTTTLFLERIGLDSLRDLPNLSDFVPDAEVVETLEVVLRGSGEAAEFLDAGASAPDLSPPA